MNPASPEQGDLVNRLRQQLILAQVRIMELEDVRDEMSPRLEEASQLLKLAQSLADEKLDEAEHLENVRIELNAQYEHMRHVQHTTNEALESARAQLAEEIKLRKNSLGEIESIQLLCRQLSEAGLEARKRIAELAPANEELVSRVERLESEHEAVVSSRSWRWTAWLRSLESWIKPSRR